MTGQDLAQVLGFLIYLLEERIDKFQDSEENDVTEDSL